jgi:hypothetical protein
MPFLFFRRIIAINQFKVFVALMTSDVEEKDNGFGACVNYHELTLRSVVKIKFGLKISSIFS